MSGGTSERSTISSRHCSPPPVSPLSAGALCACAVIALSGILTAAPTTSATDAVGTPEDFAGVYLDRYVPPAATLEPSPETQHKGRALAKYYLGLLKEKDGDRSAAVDYYRAVLEEDPSSIELAGRAARLAAQGGDTETGLAILREALKENPAVPECYLLLSSFYATFIEDGVEDSEAVRFAREAYEKFPGNPRVVGHLILTYLGFDSSEEAEKTLADALGSKSDDPIYWYRLGRVAQSVWPIPDASEGPPEKINEIYEKALEFAGPNARLVESVADFFFASGQYNRAAEIYVELIEDAPESVTPREKLGRIHALNGDFDNAILVLSELLEAHPDRPNTQKLLARIYEEEKQDREKAVEHYQNSLRLAMGEVEDYLRTSVLMLTIPDRAGDAAELLERARFHFPDSGNVMRLLAIAYYLDKQYTTAVKTFEETVNLAVEPGAVFIDDNLYYHYGASHERLHHYEKAAELFRKAISLVPAEEPARAARVYNYLGYMWLEQETNIDEAGELIIKANELIPDEGAFVDSLGWYYFMKKDYEKALATLLRAQELLGEELIDAVVLDHIAQSYFHLGQIDEAIAYEERAANLDPESKEFQERLEIYRKAADKSPPAGKPVPGKAKGAAPAE